MSDKRQYYVQRLFSNIARDYDRLNQIISFGLHHKWRKFAISKALLKPTDLILDLCCGTGDCGICAAKENPQVKVIGIDFCDEMLEIGRKKIEKSGLQDRIELKKQDISSLSFADNTFDVVTIGFGLRHLNIDEVFKEINRILKPGGRLITLDAGRPENIVIKRLHKIYFYHILPLLGKIFHGNKEPYSYLPQSLDLYLPDKGQLKILMEKAGFVAVQYFDLSFGVATVHLGFKVNNDTNFGGV
ncbi:MAG: bifunctional demethylmenaquinone methyltransferase/2-methoxy-6-polyprenyl-1,4-benzoquinol methylase UbiE [bacterium]